MTKSASLVRSGSDGSDAVGVDPARHSCVTVAMCHRRHVNGGLAVELPQGLGGSLGVEYGGLGQDLRYWRANAKMGARF
jgi:hypothetical protein